MAMPRAHAVLQIDHLHPNTGKVRGGDKVTIKGSLLQASQSVTFGGVPATGLKVEDAGQIYCFSPPGGEGACDVNVYDIYGNKSNSLTFTYVE